jgi:ubiquinol-cytochrome c reductase cytochrome b subunit
MFVFLVKAFIGVLLAINYAPTPGDVYNSLRYILTEVTAGPLIRGLHQSDGLFRSLGQLAN